MRMYLKDNHVYRERDDQQEGLAIQSRELPQEIAYINAHQIAHLEVDLLNPRALVDDEYYARLVETALNREKNPDAEKSNCDVDIAALRQCLQLKSLVIDGNIIHSETLQVLPNLRSLSINNTFGKNQVDLSQVQQLRILYIQKPGRNIIGFEKIAGLQELCIWNYIPKSRNLAALSALKNLESLALIQPRIDSLDGIEECSALKRLEIFRSRTLKDISALDRCKQHVEFICNPMPKQA